jgi:hypothetical protein
MYNPHYGYFSKQAVIFTPGQPFDFPAFRNEPAFYRELGARYTEFEDHLDAAAGGPDETRQLWHTPTELFRPHYGEAIAAYLVRNYRLTTYPYKDLIIYEMGAGRGTLMLNILDYIREVDPDVYERTRYRVIEISAALAALQKKHVGQAAARGGGDGASSSSSSSSSSSPADALRDAGARHNHLAKIEIINRSIFDWDEYVSSPCFFLAMEVIDNFAHDCIRYDVSAPDPVPLQASVVVDAEGDFFEIYQPDLDPLAARYLEVRRKATGGRFPTPYVGGGGPRALTGDEDCSEGPAARLRAALRAGLGPVQRTLRAAMTSLPGVPSLSPPEYVPTRLMQFFDVLERCFPAHRLLLSDFHALPNATRGLNAPVVQTRYRRTTVPVTTPLVSTTSPEEPFMSLRRRC